MEGISHDLTEGTIPALGCRNRGRPRRAQSEKSMCWSELAMANPYIQSRVSVLGNWRTGASETCALDGEGTYTACSSSSLPICRDTVFSVPMESLIISSCSSCVLRMWFCCWSVSSRNCRFGLSSSFSSFEYLVVP